MEMSDSSPLSRSGTSSACWSPGSSWSPSTSLASCSPMQNVNPAEELLEKASALPAILENGRKVFGPPLDYAGLRPSYICELYVANLPKSLDEVHFLAWLYRCGEVYEMRLMMESFSLSRGYAFVRYTQEIEALAAYELLKFVFVDGERLSVYRSQGKNRLYVSNIPKQLPLSSLEAGFKNAFHDMERCTAHASSATDSIRGDLNRGFAFIEFYDHETALQAKKRTTPGRMRMWGNDLKVQWAKPKSLQFNSSSNEITKPRSLGHRASLPNDYNAKLRLYCLANNWCIPVVVYGRCFRERGIQYGGILLKDSTSGELSCMVMELAVDHEIQDVHIAMCEIATLLIEENFGFPKYHYIVRLLNGFRAEILYSCCNNLDILAELRHCENYFVSSISVVELTKALQLLSQYSTEFILNLYKRSFLVLRNCISLRQHDYVAQFYSVFPKFRNNQPLNLGFNDTEITLVVCEIKIEKDYFSCLSDDIGPRKCSSGEKRRCLQLKSQRIRNYDGYILRYIDVDQLENRQFYHPAQLINAPPIWITGHSYQKSIYK